MTTFTATVPAPAPPDAVLEVLTDPYAARRWAPVAFRLRDGEDCLRPGSRVHVVGDFAGRSVGFDVDVIEASTERLALVAEGPVSFDVRYDLRATAEGSEIDATIKLHRKPGLIGRLLERAGHSLLHAGLLDQTCRKIAAAAATA
jgi:hypothetical protein